MYALRLALCRLLRLEQKPRPETAEMAQLEKQKIAFQKMIFWDGNDYEKEYRS